VLTPLARPSSGPEQPPAPDACSRGRRVLGCGLAVLASLLLLACAAPAPAPQDSFFSLDAQSATGPVASRTLAATVRVEALSARGFLGGRQIVYRTEAEPFQVYRYPQLLWEEIPGRALAAELAAALRAARRFEVVLDSQQRARSEYVLGGELVRFEHRPTAPRPHVAVEFGLTLVRSSDRRVLMSERYRGEEPTEATTPAGMVRAFNRLSRRLVAEAVAEIGRSGLGR
jgi:cholesterol transport system auxiliary component